MEISRCREKLAGAWRHAGDEEVSRCCGDKQVTKEISRS